MGRLPLHLASLQDSWELIEELSSEKSTIASEDSQNRNALHMACGLGKTSIVLEMLKDKEIAGQLINKPDIDGWTPLHWACRSKDFELVKLLIDNGAASVKKRTKDRLHWLPYHVAVFHGWESRAPVELAVDNSNLDDADEDMPSEAGKYLYEKCDCCRCVSN